MSFAVRLAREGDIGALIAIDPIAASSADRRLLIEQWVREGLCAVASRDEEVVGYGILTANFFHSAFVELLMVAEAHRRSGVGRALLGHFRLCVGPRAKLWTSTNESNGPMRALLDGAGFVPSGRIDNLDEGDPELVFVSLPNSSAGA